MFRAKKAPLPFVKWAASITLGYLALVRSQNVAALVFPLGTTWPKAHRHERPLRSWQGSNLWPGVMK